MARKEIDGRFRVDSFLDLCLLCASAPTSKQKDLANIDIYSQNGMEMELLNKINKYLTIQVEEWMPQSVCKNCISKLNVCHELVQLSEKAHGMFRSFKEQQNLDEVPLRNSQDDNLFMELPINDFSTKPVDYNIDCEIPQVVDDCLPTVDDIYTDIEQDQFLGKYSRRVMGPQFACIYLDEMAEDFRPHVKLLLINKGNFTKDEVLNEKLPRIVKNIGTLSKHLHDHRKVTGDWNIVPSFVCRSCHCSFFLRDDMVSHFKSLHPYEVTECDRCGELVCGPKHVFDKHLELHNFDNEPCALPIASDSEMFDPEYVDFSLSRITDLFKKKVMSTNYSVLKLNLAAKYIKTGMNVKIMSALQDLLRDFNVAEAQKMKLRKGKCDICQKIMAANYMAKHIRKVHVKNKGKKLPAKSVCCHCNEPVIKSKIKRHIRVHHAGGKILVCKICDDEYLATGKQQPHMLAIPVKNFKCPETLCKHAFSSQKRLDAHMAISHTTALCDICGAILKNRQLMLTHVKNVHLAQKHTGPCICEHCGQEFRSLFHMKNHIIQMHYPKYPCEICGKEFTKRRLPSHKKEHLRNYPCRYCGKLFTEKYRVTHEYSHKGINLTCTICKPPYQFKSLQSYNNHKLKHEKGEEITFPPHLLPTECPLCCKPVTRKNLKLHLKTCRGRRETKPRKAGIKRVKKKNDNPVSKARENVIACFACLLRFGTQESYDAHVTSVHPRGIPQANKNVVLRSLGFQCQYCPKVCKKRDFWKDHEARHRGEKNHSCDYCHKRFWYNTDRLTHIKRCRSLMTESPEIITVNVVDFQDS